MEKRVLFPIKECEFEYNGFKCVVLFMPFGYRCGYVGIPKEEYKIENTDYIECHGGITYSDNSLQCCDDTDKHWIGFDCAHCYDGFDTETMKEYYSDCEEIMAYLKFYEDVKPSTFWTKRQCKNECMKIVNQIRRI